jgi:hypothetical protein
MEGMVQCTAEPPPPAPTAPTTPTRDHLARPPPTPAMQPTPIVASPPSPAVVGPAPSPRRPPPQIHQPRRSKRERVAPTRLGYDGNQRHGYYADPSAWILTECGLLPPPLILKATPSDPDTLSYDEAMLDTPANGIKWMEAAAKEITSLEKNGTWIEVDASTAKTRILPGTCVFCQKRTPDREISKYKT